MADLSSVGRLFSGASGEGGVVFACKDFGDIAAAGIC